MLSITVFTSTRPSVLSKRIDLVNGQLSTSTSAHMSEGKAEATRVDNITGFIKLLDSLSSDQAIGYGTVDGLDSVKIVKAEDVAKTRGAVARSDKYFTWPKGAGVLMLDYDPGKGDKALTREQLITQLATAAPGLFRGAWAWRPSASSCIYDEATGEQLVGVTGQRVYIAVKNAADIKRAGTALFKRLWLAGFGRIEVATSGSLLVRGPIDAAVWQPSRLDFAAGALCGPGLRRIPDQAIVYEADPINSADAVPELTDDEDRRYHELVNAAKREAASSGEAVRLQYAEAKAAEWGVAPDEALALINVADDHAVLCGDYPIHLDDGEIVSVATLLSDRVKYHGRKCLDPLEPDYRGGAVVAIIHLDGQPNVFSRAHGDRTFALGVDAAKAFQASAVKPAETARLRDAIMESGGDTSQTEALVGRIHAEGGNELQRALLLAELTAQLKSAGVLTPAVRKLVNAEPEKDRGPALVPPLPEIVNVREIPHKRISGASGDHGDNAMQMITDVFQGRLCTIDGVLRWWSGISWDRMDDDRLKLLTYMALYPGQSKTPNVAGTMAAIKTLCPNRPRTPRDRLVYFTNGVLDPLTGELKAHHPHNLNTGTLTTAFTRGATCPTWHGFLDQLFGGSSDGPDRIALLQEIIGWTMIRDNLGIQKAIAFDGVSRGGKGVILEVVQAVLGFASCGQTSFSKLADDKIQSAFRYYDVMMDKEAKPPSRLLIPETIGVLNKIASNEELTIRLLHNQDPFVGRPDCKLLIGCNGLPTLIDDSGASSNRLHVLHFDRSFEGREDPTLEGRLVAEKDGIAMWALDGLVRLMNTRRFTVPESTAEADASMRDANQPLREFLRDYVEIGPDNKAHSPALYAAYKQYCIDAGVRIPGRNKFLSSLKQTLLGTGVVYKTSVRVDDTVTAGFEGLRLKDGSN